MMHISVLRKSLNLLLHPVDYSDRQAKLEAKYENRRIKIDRPVPLLQSRINISQLDFHQPRAESQLCPLLNRLPIEIRLYIYRLTFGDNIVHLYHFPKALRHTCFSPPSTAVKPCAWAKHNFAQPVYQPPAFNFYYRNRLSTTGLPVLLTCRQTYQEGVDLLYSSNIFSLNELNVLIFWSDLPLLRRQRLAAVRSLKVSWSYYQDPAHSLGLKQAPHDWKTWQRFWDIIAHEMWLRSLDVNIQYVGDLSAADSPIWQQDWVQPMMQVQGVNEVQIVVTNKDPEEKVQELRGVEEAIEKRWKSACT